MAEGKMELDELNTDAALAPATAQAIATSNPAAPSTAVVVPAEKTEAGSVSPSSDSTDIASEKTADPKAKKAEKAKKDKKAKKGKKKAGDSDSENGEDAEEEEPKKAVSYLELYRFATMKDRIYIL